jgi:nuclear transport factor 2 (NTF2) superfamily protein
MTRSPAPPFNEETARQKVKAAEDAWNARDLRRSSCRWSSG